MKMKVSIHPYKLYFKKAAGTSRGVLHSKESWFIELAQKNTKGFGECSLIPGLSPDNRNEYEKELNWLAANPGAFPQWIETKGSLFPSILFGLETALSDFHNGGNHLFGESAFTIGKAGIPINGLIWMGAPDYMKAQIRSKLESGFKCIKIKIGAIDFEAELSMLKMIRQQFDAQTIEIRVDANGAFGKAEAMEKLWQLADYQIHSIEQPIRAGQIDFMAELCAKSPVPIALDEELIGITKPIDQQLLLETIQPRYIILKPSLLGGIAAAEQWIGFAEKYNIGWWCTSALESNIGLNVIAQWVYKKANPLPQGLGTGQLYINNIDCPLTIRSGKLFYNPLKKWNLKILQV